MYNWKSIFRRNEEKHCCAQTGKIIEYITEKKCKILSALIKYALLLFFINCFYLQKKIPHDA